jgi:hypothetical protein
MTEDEVNRLAVVFYEKAKLVQAMEGINPPVLNIPAIMQMIVDTELTVTGAVPYEQWFTEETIAPHAQEDPYLWESGT